MRRMCWTAAEKLRVIYPNLMKLDYDNTRTRSSGTVTISDDLDRKSPLELFEDFYEQQNNMELNDQAGRNTSQG